MKVRYSFSPENCLRYGLVVAFAFFFSLSLRAQTAPTIAWNKTFGGNHFERLTSLQQTSDGGYILGGYSQSGISGDKSQSNRGPINTTDYWVIKLDSSGNKIWDKTFGGSYYDHLWSLQQTSDGGYILGGASSSNISGDKTQAYRGGADYWVVKLDASGNKIWDKTLGGGGDDFMSSLQQTSDGGYILGGRSNSGIGGDKSQANKGTVFPVLTNDYWVVKLDGSGNKLWDKTIGGNDYDYLFSLQQTLDGGYILGGWSKSGISGDKSQALQGGYQDYWVVKLDGSGNKIWDKTLGGSGDDLLYSLQQTSDGGYILGGYSDSGISGDKSQASQGVFDYWVVKLDGSGNKLWDKTFGGSAHDQLHSLQQTADGGYILGGFSGSGISGDKSQLSQGLSDYWIVKLDSSGNKTWDKTLGGSGNEWFGSLKQTSDGGFILGGDSFSGISGDKSQVSQGDNDYWVIKLASPCAALTATLVPSCNSGGTTLNVNIAGIQPGTAGPPSWTLTYTINGLNQTATGTTPTFTLAQNAAPGSVYSLVNIASGACTTNLTTSLTVQPIPVAPAVTPGSNCGAGSVTLSATGAPAGGSYVWYNVAAGGTAFFTNPSGTFTTPNLSATTSYYVAATNNVGCEGPRSPVTATIKTFTVNAGSNETVCADGSPVQFTGFSPAGGTWSGQGVSASGVFTPNNNLVGNQTLTYNVVQNGCTASATKQVIVNPVIQFSLGPDKEVCEGDAVVLKTDKQPGVFLWSDGSADSTLTVYQSGEYWVKLMLNDCVTSDTIQVTFKVCPNPFLPNIITLNNDGKNDTFMPQYLPVGKWQLQIFNQWGVKLFEAKDYQNNWPDKKIADGTYYYLLKNSATHQQFKGWVEVIQ